MIQLRRFSALLLLFIVAPAHGEHSLRKTKHEASSLKKQLAAGLPIDLLRTSVQDVTHRELAFAPSPSPVNDQPTLKLGKKTTPSPKPTLKPADIAMPTVLSPFGGEVAPTVIIVENDDFVATMKPTVSSFPSIVASPAPSSAGGEETTLRPTVTDSSSPSIMATSGPSSDRSDETPTAVVVDYDDFIATLRPTISAFPSIMTSSAPSSAGGEGALIPTATDSSSPSIMATPGPSSDRSEETPTTVIIDYDDFIATLRPTVSAFPSSITSSAPSSAGGEEATLIPTVTDSSSPSIITSPAPSLIGSEETPTTVIVDNDDFIATMRPTISAFPSSITSSAPSSAGGEEATLTPTVTDSTLPSVITNPAPSSVRGEETPAIVIIDHVDFIATILPTVTDSSFPSIMASPVGGEEAPTIVIVDYDDFIATLRPTVASSPLAMETTSPVDTVDIPDPEPIPEWILNATSSRVP